MVRSVSVGGLGSFAGSTLGEAISTAANDRFMDLSSTGGAMVLLVARVVVDRMSLGERELSATAALPTPSDDAQSAGTASGTASGFDSLAAGGAGIDGSTPVIGNAHLLYDQYRHNMPNPRPMRLAETLS